MKWERRPSDQVAIDDLMSSGIHRVPATLLAIRGVDASMAPAFLSPRLVDMTSPWLLADMGKAAAAIADAIRGGVKIMVHTDYDCDGLTSAALLSAFLLEAGADFFPYIPTRDEGYGLRPEGVAVAVAQGARLILTADCGITAVAEALLCREHGIELVITDHHLPDAELPDAKAIVNPHRHGDQFPFKGLAGVGVAFYLLVAVRKHLRDARHRGGDVDLRALLDLVALGTIADVVPLLGDNRTLVRHGIEVMESEPRLGLGYLMEAAGLTRGVCAQDVAFRLAPRINACGRLGSPHPAYRLLVTDDPSEAERLALELSDLNSQRQLIEERIMSEVEEQIHKRTMLDRKALVVAGNWPHGVVGITAGKLADKYHRPVILLAIEGDVAKGSGRSGTGFHLKDALGACAPLLDGYGGHAQAAGLSLPSIWVDEFREAFCRVADKLVPDELLQEDLLIDMELAGEQISLETVDACASLEPFGEGNPPPLFLIKNAELDDCRIMKGKHISMDLRSAGKRFRAVGFNRQPPKAGTGHVDLVCSMARSEWNGESRLDVHVRDCRPSGVR